MASFAEIIELLGVLYISLQDLEVSGNGDIKGLSRFACIPAELSS